MLEHQLELKSIFLRLYTILFLIGITADVSADQQDEEKRIVKARELFYSSIEDKNKIKPAIQAFHDLMSQYPQYEGRALTYLGALTALRGKHAFWPHDKLRYTKRGLGMLDQGVTKCPDDVESLFIHGSTCFYLPFFFERSDDAQEKFRQIVNLLPEKYFEYDYELLQNVVEFILKNAKLDEDEKKRLQDMKEIWEEVRAD